MREFDLDDGFWSDALAALGSAAPAADLRVRWPACAELVEELVVDSGREPLLVGVRAGTNGRNPRLLAVLIAAFLARAGRPALLLDLSPDTRWLEQLLGGDFKEGLIDHLRFEAPVEQCVRPTGLPGLDAMSGGAWFLTGSPLEDAPGIRAALERLRQGRSVIVTLPPPLEAGDRAGIAALCGALVTVEERGSEAPLAGSERAVVRLTGDTEAARDLAHLASRFLGPLPALLAAMSGAQAGRAEPPAVAGRAAARGDASRADPAERADDDFEFLRRFEAAPAAFDFSAAQQATPAGHDFDFGAPDDGSRETGRVPGRHARRLARGGRARRRSPSTRVLVAAGIGVVALVAALVAGRGIASEVAGWIFGPGESPAYGDVAFESSAPIGLDAAPEVLGPLVLDDSVPRDSAAAAVRDSAALASAGEPADSLPAEPAVEAPPGRRVPYSVHVGSYQSIESAQRVVDRLADTGQAATVAPVSIPGKGLWYRVFVGVYADSSAARRARDRLQSSSIVEEALVRSAPWSFEIGVYPTRDAARGDLEALRRQGVVAYTLGEGPVRLYAGAYQSRDEGEILARTLASIPAARSATLTLREE